MNNQTQVKNNFGFIPDETSPDTTSQQQSTKTPKSSKNSSPNSDNKKEEKENKFGFIPDGQEKNEEKEEVLQEDEVMRYIMQPVKAVGYGLLAKFLPPMASAGILAAEVGKGVGQMFKPTEEIAQLKSDLTDMKGDFERLGIPWDAKKEAHVMKRAERDLFDYLPLPSSMMKYLEEKYGVPFEAKTTGQENVSIVSDVAIGGGKGVVGKLVGPGTAVALYNGLIAHGVPEGVAGFFARAIGAATGHGFNMMKKENAPKPEQPKPSTAQKVNQTFTGTPPGGTPPGGTPPKATTELPNQPTVDKIRQQDLYRPKGTPSEVFARESLPEPVEAGTKRRIEYKQKPLEEVPQEQVTEQQAEQVEQAEPAKKSLSRRTEELAPGVLKQEERTSRPAAIKASKAPRNSPISAIARRELEAEGISPAEETTPQKPIDLVGENVSRFKANDSVGGRRVVEIFRDQEQVVKGESNLLYNIQRAETEAIPVRQTNRLYRRLNTLSEEMGQPSDTDLAGATREINKLIAELEHVDRVQNPIDLQDLIDRKREIRTKLSWKMPNDHRNVYYRAINAIDEAIADSFQGHAVPLEAYTLAENHYRNNYARFFKHPEGENLLNNHQMHYASVYKRMQDPDVYHYLVPILEEVPEGQMHAGMLRRGIVQSKLEPVILNKEGHIRGNLQRAEINDALNELPFHVSQAERDNIWRTVHRMRTEGREALNLRKQPTNLTRTAAQKAKEVAVERARKGQLKEKQGKQKKAQTDAEKQAKKEFNAKKNEVVKRNEATEAKNKKGFFGDLSDAEVINKFKTVDGIKEIQANMVETTENIALFNQAKRDSAIRILTKGKFQNATDMDKSIAEALADIDTEHLLENLLGKKELTKVKDLMKARAKEVRAMEQLDKTINERMEKLKTKLSDAEKAKIEREIKGLKQSRAMRALVYASKEVIHHLTKNAPIPKQMLHNAIDVSVEKGAELLTGKKK